jgi:glycosyltransferase involved in cell wall biosynthesis
MRISVVIPLYNKRDFIEDTINSVFSQTVQPFEILIIDDGSTDGSYEKVISLNLPVVRLIRQQNSGVSGARNRGIEEAKGDWIAFLDADDIWLPEFLKKMMELHQRFLDCNVLSSTYFLEDFIGRRDEIVLKNIPFNGREGILTNYFQVAANSHPPVCSSAVVVRKESLLNINGFPVGTESGEDLLTWTFLAINNKIAYTLEPLAVFVQNSAHTYDNKPNRIPQIPDYVGSELEKLAQQNAEIIGLRQYVALWYKMRASVFLRLGMRKNAFNQGMRSLRYNPVSMKVYFYLILVFMPLRIVLEIFKIQGRR